MRFYTTDHGRLMMERKIGTDNSITIEVERTVGGKVVQNEAAYRDYDNEIAAYKASLSPGEPAADAPLAPVKKGGRKKST